METVRHTQWILEMRCLCCRIVPSYNTIHNIDVIVMASSNFHMDLFGFELFPRILFPLIYVLVWFAPNFEQMRALSTILTAMKVMPSKRNRYRQTEWEWKPEYV